jgi:hypothetical protein
VFRTRSSCSRGSRSRCARPPRRSGDRDHPAGDHVTRRAFARDPAPPGHLRRAGAPRGRARVDPRRWADARRAGADHGAVSAQRHGWGHGWRVPSPVTPPPCMGPWLPWAARGTPLANPCFARCALRDLPWPHISV